MLSEELAAQLSIQPFDIIEHSAFSIQHYLSLFATASQFTTFHQAEM